MRHLSSAHWWWPQTLHTACLWGGSTVPWGVEKHFINWEIILASFVSGCLTGGLWKPSVTLCSVVDENLLRVYQVTHKEFENTLPKWVKLGLFVLEPHLAMLKAYCWLCSQGSLQAGLRDAGDLTGVSHVWDQFLYLYFTLTDKHSFIHSHQVFIFP